MSDEHAELTGPDFTLGYPLADLADGAMLAGHANGKAVLVARQGDEVFAIGASCTHYGGPLASGLLVGDTVRCPWHHACFSLRTGQAVRAPALKPVARWTVELRGASFVVRGEMEPAELLVEDTTAQPDGRSVPASIVIVGAGAAGNAAAETLRREGYQGSVTMIGAEESVPYDRPNLSKDYLAGSAPEEWIPLRSPEFYAQHHIVLVPGRRVTAIDTSARHVTLDDGRTIAFGALLLATGAEPIRLPIPAAAGSRVLYLRSLADSRAIVAAAKDARAVVVMGASFIGLEVAAALRARELAVHVVAPEQRPLERVLGPALGDFVRGVHEAHGVVFHLGRTAARIDAGSVTLDDGAVIAADLVVVGVGVRPRVELAEQGGLATDKGVVVDEFLETSAAGVYAAGDIARYPDALTGERIRVEHWVVAERQGQAAARNMLGRRERFRAVPFFWSQHYDQTISYVGHAERWDTVEIDGEPASGDCTVRYIADGRTAAVATVGRDRASLEAEHAMEQAMARTDAPVWLITGCSTGFGRELASAVLARGYRAVVTARDPGSVQDIVGAHGERALVLALDVTDAAQVRAAVQAAEARFGRIDVLVNNAGIGYFGAVEESDEAEVRRMFEVNVFGLGRMIQAVLPGMRRRRSGHIVNISSIGGLRAFPAVGFYNATKFAVVGLSESLALEVEPLGIRVTIVEPSGFRTDWAGRSANEAPFEIADYAATAGANRRSIRGNSGRQPGDPVRAAEAIITAVEAPAPPLHLLLGKAALKGAHFKLDLLRRDFDAWQATTVGADFPEGE